MTYRRLTISITDQDGNPIAAEEVDLEQAHYLILADIEHVAERLRELARAAEDQR